MKISLFPICCAFTALLGFQPANLLAEGGDKRPDNGDWGVNRRVANEQKGYTELQGTFSGMQSIYIPTDEDGKVTSVTNPFNDKPTAYLGGSLGNGVPEIDAGLQYEWRRVVLNKLDDVEIADVKELDPGYAAFISKNGAFSNPKVAESTPGNPAVLRWRPWRGYKDSYTIHYKVWNGTQKFKLNATQSIIPVRGAVSLTLGGDFKGTFFWLGTTPGPGGATEPNSPVKPTVEHSNESNARVESPTPASSTTTGFVTLNGVPAGVTVWPYQSDSPLFKAFPLDNLADGNIKNIRGKRVVGITQGSKIKGVTDGSSFQCKFEGGFVTFYTDTENTINSRAHGHAWDVADVDNGGDKKATGYDTQPNLPGGQAIVPGKIDPYDPPALDRTWFDIITPGAQYKTAFPVMGNPARQTNSAGLKEEGLSRYTQETVRVNLKNATRAWGYRVEPNE